MQSNAGLLSKITDNQYNFLTMEGELLLEGDLRLPDGYYSNLDLSNVSVNKHSTTTLETRLSSQNKFLNEGFDTSECLDMGDDCSNPNDCDCECAEP